VLGVATLVAAAHEVFQVERITVPDQVTDFLEALDGAVGAGLHDAVDNLNDVIVDAWLVVQLGLQHFAQILSSLEHLIRSRLEELLFFCNGFHHLVET
jgi:hypothetical protein